MIEGYDEARDGVVLIDRGPRPLLRMYGRAPTRMLDGMITGAIPPPPRPLKEDLTVPLRGRMEYSAMLTPKGRMVTDLRVARLGGGETDALLLELPPAGVEAARSHFGTYLPPLFATVEAPPEPTASIALVGPDSANVIALLLPQVELDLREMAEGDGLVFPDDSAVGLRIVRSGDVAPLAFELIGTRSGVDGWKARIAARDVEGAPSKLWSVLRLERGRPEFGAEMDEDTLLPEAGIEARAIGPAKGCYTGQEVVVRIRDRGHVNRHLRGILLGEAPLPDFGTTLFDPESERSVGEIRSSVHSPRMGQGIALGYVRREVTPPAELRLEGPEGALVAVRALSDEGWSLLEGDPSEEG